MSTLDSITARTDRRASVIHLRGEIDLELREQASRALREVLLASLPVVIDLSEVRFIDSSGIAFLVQCRRACQEAGLSCTLRAVPDATAEVLTLLGLDDLLDDGQAVG